jgi:hypothetical protein
MQAIGDSAFLKVIGSHLDFHAVTREDAHAMDPHATGECAEKLVILRLVGDNPDTEGSVWKTFFHNADEFNDIFGHTEG